MMLIPCPVCFIGNVGIMPIVTFDPEVRAHCAPLAALARDNRAEDDAYLVLTCPVCNQEMDDSPLRVGLGPSEEEIIIIFELEPDEDDDE